MLRGKGPAALGSNFLKLWTASAVSNFGDGIRWTALPLFAATLTRDPTRIAAIDFAATMPWLLFALVAGALVDRWDRRRAMVTSNAFRAVVMTLLGVSVLADFASLPLIYVLAFLLGTAETIFDNAAQAMTPRVVARADLERANGTLFTAELVANQFAGPPAGGFLFGIKQAVPFFTDAASFAFSASLVSTLKGNFRTERPATDIPTRLRTEIWEGLRWLWNHRLLRTFAVMVGVWNLLNTATFSIFVLYALQILDLGPVGYGVLLSTMVIGNVIGSFIAPRVGKIGQGTTLILTVVLGAGSELGIALASHSVVVGAMLAISGVSLIVWNVITVSLRQSIIPDRLLGRVNSVYRLLAYGMMPIGAALGGLLADAFGLRAPYYVAAVVLGIMAIAALPVVNNASIAAARAEAAD
jgi:MFS family permease